MKTRERLYHLMHRWNPVGVIDMLDEGDLPREDFVVLCELINDELSGRSDIGAVAKLLEGYRTHLGLAPRPDFDSATAAAIVECEERRTLPRNWN